MKLAIALALLILWGTTQAAISNGSSYDERCDIARSLAIKDALQNYSIREFEASQKHLCKEINDDINCMFQRELSTEVAGTFKKVVNERAKKEDGLCRVDVTIEVDKVRLLKVDVNGKSKYKSGDILELTVVTKEPLFVYIYNDHATGIQRLFPHLENKHELVAGTFKLEDHNKVRYQMYVASPYETSEETLIVVFSKVKLTFKNRLSKLEFYEIIKSTPAFSRRVMYHNFIINRRSL